MNKVTVIIPVYNAQNTLNLCLKSVSNQTFENFEVIIVDDGSTDDSCSIYKKYALNDARFSYIITENKGVSHARNVGIDSANGKYICFIDADDYIEPDYISSLLDALEKTNSHLIFCGWFENEKDVGLSARQSIMNGEEALYYLFSSKYNHNFAVWNKLFIKDYIGDTRFDEQLSYLEDGVFVCDYIKADMKMTVLERPLYHYVLFEDSLSHNSALDQKRMSAITSVIRMKDQVMQYSSRLEYVAKARCFENTCFILFDSYKNGYRKEVLKERKRLLRYWLEYYAFNPASLRTKVRFFLYSLIVLFNFGEHAANYVESLRK